MSSHHDLARAHVMKGRNIVARQRERIAEISGKGHDSSLSNRLLRTFEETLTIFEADLRRLDAQQAALVP